MPSLPWISRAYFHLHADTIMCNERLHAHSHTLRDRFMRIIHHGEHMVASPTYALSNTCDTHTMIMV